MPVCATFWSVNLRTKLGIGSALVVGGILLGLNMLRAFEHRNVYHPTREVYAKPGDLNLAHEEVDLVAEDGTHLHGWYFPVSGEGPRSRLVILHCHGNGGNITGRLTSYSVLLGLGVNVLAFDYRGYGSSEGTPSETGTYLDTHAAYQWLRDKGFAARDIIVQGESLGGGIGSQLVATRPVGGLILQSTFTSIPDVGAEIFWFLPVRTLASIQYDTRSRLPEIRVPVLVMHSRQDETVGYRHAEKNFSAANEPKLFQELVGGHNETLYVSQREYLKGMNQFLDLVLDQPAGE